MDRNQRQVTLVVDNTGIKTKLDDTFNFHKVQEYMKSPQFKNLLIEEGKPPIRSTDQLHFHFLSEDSQQKSKDLKLNDFNPKKKLIFYIKVTKPKQIPKQGPILDNNIQKSSNIFMNLTFEDKSQNAQNQKITFKIEQNSLFSKAIQQVISSFRKKQSQMKRLGNKISQLQEQESKRPRRFQQQQKLWHQAKL